MSYPGVTETRDQREIMTLAAIMDAVNKKQLAAAMDTVVQRILSIQTAKGSKEGTWAKSELLELITPGSASLIPAGLSSIGK